MVFRYPNNLCCCCILPNCFAVQVAVHIAYLLYLIVIPYAVVADVEMEKHLVQSSEIHIVDKIVIVETSVNPVVQKSSSGTQIDSCMRKTRIKMIQMIDWKEILLSWTHLVYFCWSSLSTTIFFLFSLPQTPSRNSSLVSLEIFPPSPPFFFFDSFGWSSPKGAPCFSTLSAYSNSFSVLLLISSPSKNWLELTAFFPFYFFIFN